ncbi:MAG: hypothetical protein ACLFTT_08065 [Candidatus Hydrogenedentota bacterium]
MAILAEVAHGWAEQLGTPDALRSAVRERLLAANPLPVGGGPLDEYPEDAVVALLEPQTCVREDFRHGVARGWNDARREVEPILTDRFLEHDDRERLGQPFSRVFRVASVSESDLLREGVRAALPLVVGPNTLATPSQVQDVIAAAMGYSDEADRATWIKALEQEDIAGYAFRMLITLSANATDDLAGYLKKLITRQFVGGWKIDVWFLGEYLVTALGKAEAEDIIRRAILGFIEEYPGKWAEIRHKPVDNPCWPEDVIKQIASARQRQGQEIVTHIPSQAIESRSEYTPRAVLCDLGIPRFWPRSEKTARGAGTSEENRRKKVRSNIQQERKRAV